MKPNEIIKEINRLELPEKLLLVEDIWDSIAHHPLPIPTWQKMELEKRYNKYQEGALELYDWKTVRTIKRKTWEFGKLKGKLYTKGPASISATNNLQKIFDTLNWLFNMANSSIENQGELEIE